MFRVQSDEVCVRVYLVHIFCEKINRVVLKAFIYQQEFKALAWSYLLDNPLSKICNLFLLE